MTYVFIELKTGEWEGTPCPAEYGGARMGTGRTGTRIRPASGEELTALCKEYIPFWGELTPDQQNRLKSSAALEEADRGAVLHNGAEDCVGVLVLLKGRVRAYILSEEGREVTLYRLFPRDFCLFSASCMMKGIECELSIVTEEETEYLHIPAEAYRSIMQESAAASNYTNEVMGARFSDVMWLLNQVLYKKLDSRLAAFLLEEKDLEEAADGVLSLTHEEIARHLGSAREVITRMLKYFQNEGLVKLTRGSIALLDEAALRRVAGDSLR